MRTENAATSKTLPTEPSATTRLPARSYRDLHVWQKAHEFVLAVYQMTQRFPSSELYGLTSQLRREAVSIPANIAESFRRRGNADKGRFLNFAQTSADEAGYYLFLANDLGYADTAGERVQLDEVCRILNVYTSKVGKNTPQFSILNSNQHGQANRIS